MKKNENNSTAKEKFLQFSTPEQEKEYLRFKKCCICGRPYIGYGNNPEPVKSINAGMCCNVCNWRFVYPARQGATV